MQSLQVPLVRALTACDGLWRMAAQVYWEGKYPSYECAGNFGVPAVTEDPAKLKELETIELKHGRCARSPRPMQCACASHLGLAALLHTHSSS